MPKVWAGLAREFARAGHHVSIMARKFAGQPHEEREGNVRIVRTRGYAQSASIVHDLAKDFAYAANVVRQLPAADILVTNDFWVPALAPLLRRSAGATVVCAARFPKGQYRLYSRVAKVVAISSAVRSAIVRERPQLADKTVVIPLPVDVAVISATADAGARGQRTLLYVGRVHPEKGIEVLLRAFATAALHAPGWRLRIVGPEAVSDGGGGERFGAAMGELARGLEVEFAGPVFDKQRLADEYRAADLFCYPSLAERGEAFGLAPLEAMASGVAPIVSSLECFRDFVREGENGWVFDHRTPDAAQRLATVLTKAMTDDAARAALARRAEVDARRFAYGPVAQQYLDEFNRTLDGY